MFPFHVTHLQARLNEIITSGAKTSQSNGSPSWMVDGAGLPSNAFDLLPKLVITALILRKFLVNDLFRVA